MRVIRLCCGSGDGETTACLMTAANMLIGRSLDNDKATKHNCICRIIREFIIFTNDAMPDLTRHRLYTPLIWEILGTASGNLTIQRERAEHAAHAAIAIANRPDAMSCSRLNAVNLAREIEGGSIAETTISLATQLIIECAQHSPKAWNECPKIIREMAAIGDRRPVETVLTEQQLCDRLGSYPNS